MADPVETLGLPRMGVREQMVHRRDALTQRLANLSSALSYAQKYRQNDARTIDSLEGMWNSAFLALHQLENALRKE